MITDDEREQLSQALSTPRMVFHIVAGGNFDTLLTKIIGQHVTNQLEEVTRQRDVLAQAMWDARIELGFDTDGDKVPGHAIAGMGYDWFADQHVQEAKEIRRDFDAALDEIPN